MLSLLTPIDLSLLRPPAFEIHAIDLDVDLHDVVWQRINNSHGTSYYPANVGEHDTTLMYNSPRSSVWRK